MDWTIEQLEAAVVSYANMLEMQAKQKRFNKREIYRDLSQAYGRSEKAWEYRMQNISFIYFSNGRDYVHGLKPAKNVGANVLPTLEELIHKHDPTLSQSILSFDAEVTKFRRANNLSKPEGKAVPNRQEKNTAVYDRDPRVVAWLLDNSGGKCECCMKAAPFRKSSGELYLEVHHLRRLADGGTDTITNAIAICPNCHREMHYGENRKILLRLVYEKIPRLK